MKLNIQNIVKTYNISIVINKLSIILELDIYALLGSNGSGKSTLMNIITDSGEITYTDNQGNTENINQMHVRFRAFS